jgi:hypothetical protein
MGDLSEADARRIFDNKVSICKVLGGDVRAQCVAAGLSLGLIEKFLADDRELTAFFNLHDSAGNPLK